MHASRYAVALLAVVALVAAPRAAQAQYDHWELNLHAGLLYNDLFESDATEPLFGAKVMRHWDNHWGFGVNFDYVPAGETVVYHNIPESDVDLYLTTLDLEYTIPSSGPAWAHLGVGAGVATVQIDSAEFDTFGNPRTGDRLFLEESQNKFLLSPYAGFKILNSRTDPWFAFRVDVRDHIVYFPARERAFPASETPEVGDKITFDRWRNNWSIAAGFSFLFGGAPSWDEPVPVTCPVCPVVEPEPEPEPALVCVDDQWWYTSDATIAVNGRDWIKFGEARAIPRDELIRIGEVDGIPVYIRHDAEVPYQEIFVPLCSPEGFYQPYVPEREVRGTTG